jgi:hypothetical protein
MSIISQLKGGFCGAMVAFALQLGCAHAAEIARSVGATQLKFPIPLGQCLAEESNARDDLFIRRLDTLLRNSGNTLYVVAIECSRQETWRKGVDGNVVDYSTYYVPNQSVNPVMEGDKSALRKELCGDMRKQGDATLAPAKDMVAKSAKELNTNMALNSTKFIGVVAEDAHACYLALLVGVRGADERNLLLLVLISSTVVRGKPIFSAIYHQYHGPETTERGLQEAKGLMAQLDESNP